jgi:hypothetical protein
MNKTGRPKGIKDSQPRKKRKQWHYTELKFLREHYYDMTAKELAEALNKSVSSVTMTAKECGLKQKGTHSFREYKFDYFFNNNCFDNICGVYCIKHRFSSKMYIGSAEDIKLRVKQHYDLLNNNKHENKSLQDDWIIENFNIGILCKTKDYANKEQEYLSSIYEKYLYNIVQLLPEPQMTEMQKKKFWKKVDVSDDNNKCWEWMGSQIKGYGQKSCSYKSYAAHRIAYYLHYNEWPNGMMVLHICNNKLCCNPHHLKLGTSYENIQDAKKDGLIIPLLGENHPSTYITNKQCLEIVDKIKNGVSCAKIVKEYNIKNSVVYHIKHGYSWKHLVSDDDIKQMKQFNYWGENKAELRQKIKDKLLGEQSSRKSRKTYRIIIDDELLQKIRLDLINGKAQWKIAEELKLPPNKIAKINKELMNTTTDRKLYNGAILTIVFLLQQKKKTIEEIAKIFRCSEQRILDIKNGNIRRDIINDEDVEMMRDE